MSNVFYLFGVNKITVLFILWSYCEFKVKLNEQKKKNSGKSSKSVYSKLVSVK